MAVDRDPFLFIRLLQSPPGQEAILAFLESWDRDHNLGRALEAAQQVLENNGVWELTVIAIFLDGLRLIAKSTSTHDKNQSS
jgi:hypothetical protein